MKKLFAFLLAAVLLLTIAGCAQKDNGLTGWAYVEDKGTLVIGLDDTFAPMGFRDEQDKLVGFDIDLATEVAKVLNIEVSFQSIDWKSKEVALSSKRVDCLWNGMSATPERQESMALTKKYLNNRLVIMALKADVQVASAADLARYNVGTQSDSAALEAMQAHDAYASFQSKVKEYSTYDEAILDMQAGRVDCIVVDETLGEYKNARMDGAMHICDFNFGDDFYAIGCRKGETDLADKLNGALQTLITNGKAKEISEKWFGTDIMILEGYDAA